MKTCYKCKLSKPPQKFYFRKETLKYRPLCIKCQLLKNMEYRKSQLGKNTYTEYKSSSAYKIKLFKANKSPKKKLALKRYAKSLNGRLKRNINQTFRYCKQLKAMPKWLDNSQRELIKMNYQLAHYLTEVTGIPHQVDHIYPLQGKNSSGLHVPWNLRVIPAHENQIKKNNII